MRRRRLLAALPFVLAGCAAGPGGGPGTDGGTDAPTDATTTDATTTTDGEPTTRPDPAAYPDYGDDVDRLVGYEAAAEDPPILLTPSATEASLPSAELSMTLRNRAERAFKTNFYGWVLHKRVDGDWYRVAPRYWPQPLMTLEPGGEHTWRLRLRSESPPTGASSAGGTEDLTLVGLGGGTYAFAVDGWFADTDYEHKTVGAARFDLQGDPLALEATPAVTDVSRDGGVVTVRAENPSGADDGRRGTFVLTRTDDAPNVRRLITEQVVRRWPLRDALAQAADGVTEVRVEARTSTYPAFGVQDDAPAIRYDGRTWAVSATAEEGE